MMQFTSNFLTSGVGDAAVTVAAVIAAVAVVAVAVASAVAVVDVADAVTSAVAPALIQSKCVNSE
jgi:hypothetical protein